MSEEILKALTQLFAIITKQDGSVTEEEYQYVQNFFYMELDRDSVKEYLTIYEQAVGYDPEHPHYEKAAGQKRASVRDTVRSLNISKKINKTLSQKQKAVVVLRLLELLKSDNQLTPLGVEIIDTISTIFNIPTHEYNLLKRYVKFDQTSELDSGKFLIITDEEKASASKDIAAKKLVSDIEGEIVIIKLETVNMYLIKYKGPDEVILNGFIMLPNLSYLLSPGSTIKSQRGQAIYYSDITRAFDTEKTTNRISFNAHHINYQFPNGAFGLKNINVTEQTGTLIGIMGASGAGKSTLLNVLAGIDKPSSGNIKINGIDPSKDRKNDLDGVSGYVAQDDLLIEELTVYQNLYYNAKLSMNNLSEKELHEAVISTLQSLGLEFTSDLKVGSVLQKTISGGQRKRLNIALELIRQPAILFVDEPTSGLSSRDSENVMDLLKELSQKGKIIFVVIHQPSSDIYKMLDKVIIMDTGGYQVYYGNPIEAITYFKEVTRQVDRFRSICHTCGNVTPEQIFNIIEARVVDEFGQFTSKRKVTPTQWFGLYRDNFPLQRIEDVSEKPPKTLSRPNILNQARIFTTRDFLSKIENRQYLMINLLEAPLLAAILALVIRYKNSPGGNLEYVFRFNENIPAFIMMSIVVALFVGLSVSAEEIIHDRKILKREHFLNLSWSSYLFSKVIILFSLSAIQTLLFVFIGNSILEIKGMTPMFWLVLFSSSCMANVLGLNISSAFKSAVTVYILIPIILIPQMIFSGLLFSFDKLNDAISGRGRVPIVADLMTSRWAFEAMTVHQFTQNEFEEPYYEFDAEIKQSEFKTSFWIPAVRNKVNFVANNFYLDDSVTLLKVESELAYFTRELTRESYKPEDVSLNLDSISVSDLSPRYFLQVNQYLNRINSNYLDIANEAQRKKDRLVYLFENDERYDYDVNSYKNDYYNESLADLVRNIGVRNRILESKTGFVQQLDAIYHTPEKPSNILDYRTHFYAPKKYFFSLLIDTPTFNVLVIWMMTVLLFLTVYLKIPEKLISIFERR